MPLTPQVDLVGVGLNATDTLIPLAEFPACGSDTTGAGDIFHAGFLYGLLQGWELDRQLEFSCAAAAMNCMADGARGGIQKVAAIEAFMAEAERYPRPAELAAAVW